MAVTIPWLDSLFFVEILQLEEDSKEIRGVVTDLTYKSEFVEDFFSTIIRVKVNYTIKYHDEEKKLKQSFIIKVPLSGKNCNESIFVKNELQIYKDYIPNVNKFVLLDIAPKCYKCSRTNCLVVEDLTEVGYVTCKSGQLDYKQATAALVALAKLHAASVVVKQNDPECMERNGIETCYTHDPKYATRFKPQMLMRLYGLATILRTMEHCERFGDILIDVSEEFWDLMVDVFRPSSKLNVLNHGDFWTNSILFQYDSAGLVIDVKFINYHMRRFCSPAIDLLCFFWTSADIGVRMRMYELVEMYRHTLNTSLAELGCSVRLLRHELKEEISKCSPIILLLCLYLPVVFPDPSCILNPNQSYSEENLSSLDFDVNPLLLPFKGKEYRFALIEMCKELENMKIFQILVKNKKEK